MTGDLNQWKDISCPWIEGPDVGAMAALPTAAHVVKAIPVKTPAAFFAETGKLTLKFL